MFVILYTLWDRGSGCKEQLNIMNGIIKFCIFLPNAYNHKGKNPHVLQFENPVNVPYLLHFFPRQSQIDRMLFVNKKHSRNVFFPLFTH